MLQLDILSLSEDCASLAGYLCLFCMIYKLNLTHELSCLPLTLPHTQAESYVWYLVVTRIILRNGRLPVLLVSSWLRELVEGIHREWLWKEYTQSSWKIWVPGAQLSDTFSVPRLCWSPCCVTSSCAVLQIMFYLGWNTGVSISVWFGFLYVLLSFKMFVVFVFFLIE